jgi:hypothetical protein
LVCPPRGVRAGVFREWKNVRENVIRIPFFAFALMTGNASRIRTFIADYLSCRITQEDIGKGKQPSTLVDIAVCICSKLIIWIFL